VTSFFFDPVLRFVGRDECILCLFPSTFLHSARSFFLVGASCKLLRLSERSFPSLPHLLRRCVVRIERGGPFDLSRCFFITRAVDKFNSFSFFLFRSPSSQKARQDCVGPSFPPPPLTLRLSRLWRACGLEISFPPQISYFIWIPPILAVNDCSEYYRFLCGIP